MSDSEVTTPTFTSSEKTVGRVKWFNNKVGYGFLTTCDDENKDVFVHHSQLKVGSQQYKYLVEGEYVHFVVSDSTGNDHKHLATEVTGINGGMLMCETRNAQQEQREKTEGGRQGGKRGKVVRKVARVSSEPEEEVDPRVNVENDSEV